MKIFKKFIFIITTIILTILVSYNIYSFICINILNKDFVTINGYAFLEVVSGSMEPEINIGDIIIIDTKEKDYKKGNVVTYYDSNGLFVTHRIISIENTEIITKGDHNNTEDKPISQNDIIGRAVYKIRYAGKVLEAVKSPLTMLMILIIGILVCVFVSIGPEDNSLLSEDEKAFQEFLKNKEKRSR